MVYHICNRATEKVRLFSSDDDYELWIKTFREASRSISPGSLRLLSDAKSLASADQLPGICDD